jgi:hypothetical protein
MIRLRIYGKAIFNNTGSFYILRLNRHHIATGCRRGSKMFTTKCHAAVFCTAALLMFTEGCYTKFAVFEPVSTAAKADSVRAAGADKETCIWERDLMGYPYLHCYPSYYPRQWYLYNYSPWWYHNDRHLYNADQCPPYYSYDPGCGCCRYFLNDPGRTGLRQPVTGAESAHSAHSADTVKDSSRVSITAASHMSVKIPLQGNPVTANTSAGATAITGPSSRSTTDSLVVKQQPAPVQAADTLSAPHDTVQVIPVKKIRRSMRGR